VVAGTGTAGAFAYVEDNPTQNLSPSAVSSVGGSQPHTNFQPYLCVDFIISLFGIFPSQT
jgi:microcystin-dependent protein